MAFNDLSRHLFVKLPRLQEWIVSKGSVDDIIKDPFEFCESLRLLLQSYREVNNHTAIFICLEFLKHCLHHFSSEHRTECFKILIEEVLHCSLIYEVNSIVYMFLSELVNKDISMKSVVMEMLTHASNSNELRFRVNSEQLLVALTKEYHINETKSHKTNILEINFLPPSLLEQWILSQDEVEICQTLEEITKLYRALPINKRLEAANDVHLIFKQVLISMKQESSNIIVNGLRLLGDLYCDHFSRIVQDLTILFTRLQRYLDDSRTQVRKEAFNLGAILVTRTPVTVTARFIVGALENEPSYPDISMKLSSLLFLISTSSVLHSISSALNRILVAIVSHFGNMQNDYYNLGLNTVAMAFFVLSKGEADSHHRGGRSKDSSMKMMKFLNLPEATATEIQRKVNLIEFPDFENICIFEEISRSSFDQYEFDYSENVASISLNERNEVNTEKMFPQISGFSPPRISSKQQHVDEFLQTSLPNDTIFPSPSPSPWVETNNDNIINSDNMMWNDNYRTNSPDVVFDRSKLKTIKSGRKPGSRRAHTADGAEDALPQLQKWTEFPGVLNTEFDCHQSMSYSPIRDKIEKVAPQTPIEVGLYSYDGTRIQHLEKRSGNLIPKHPNTQKRVRQIKRNAFQPAEMKVEKIQELQEPFAEVETKAADGDFLSNELSSGTANNSAHQQIIDEFRYLEHDELLPCEHPHKDCAHVLRDLTVGQWPEIYHTLNMLRRLCHHHANIMSQNVQLHSVVVGVSKQVENLRSSVTKNALLTLCDLFTTFGNQLDSEISLVMKVLVKKVTDSNSFISESAEDVMKAIIVNASSSLSLSALFVALESKNSAVRGRISQFIFELIQLKSSELTGCKALIELKSRIGKMLTDQSQDARQYAREILRIMISTGLISRKQMEESVGIDAVDRAFITEYGKASSSTMNSPSPSKFTPRKTTLVSHGEKKNTPTKEESSLCIDTREGLSISGVSPRSKHAEPLQPISKRKMQIKSQPTPLTKKQQESHPEFLALSDMFQGLNSKVWVERTENLTLLANSIIKNEELFQAAGKIETCLDRIFDRLEDGNVKVINHALVCLQRINTVVPDLLPSNFKISFPRILSASVNSNRHVAISASELLNSLLERAEQDLVIEHLCVFAIHEKDRMRCAVLKSISFFISWFASSHSQSNLVTILKRHFFPVILQVIQAPKLTSDVRLAVSETLKTIQNHVQESIVQWTDSPTTISELKRILAT